MKMGQFFQAKKWRRSTTSRLVELKSLLDRQQEILNYLPLFDALGNHISTLDNLGVRLAVIDNLGARLEVIDGLGARLGVIDDMAHTLRQLQDLKDFANLVSTVRPVVDNYLSGNHEIIESVRTDVETLSVLMLSLQMQLNHLDEHLKKISEL